MSDAKCEWRQHDSWDMSGVWNTQCGHTFCFLDNGTEEHGPCEDGINYCCYCGHKIVRIEAVEEADEG